MADTRRLRKGYVTLAMAVPEEVAYLIRVQSVMARKSLGDYVTSLVQATAKPGRKTLPELLAGTDGVEFREGGEMVLKTSGKATRRPQATSDEFGAGAMTWDELVAALEAQGKTHRELRQALGLSNTSVWKNDGIPAKHVARIKEFLVTGA